MASEPERPVEGEQRQSPEAAGYIATGMGVNQNAELGAMRTPHDHAGHGSAWITAVSVVAAIALVALIAASVA